MNTGIQPTYKDRLRQLKGLVRQMREAQRRFYQTRDFKDLSKAKSLEQKVDRLLVDEDQKRLWEPDDE